MIYIKKFFSILTYKQKAKFYLIFILMLVGMLLDILGISMVIPLINALNGEGLNQQFVYLKKIIYFLNFNNFHDNIFVLIAFFIGLIFTAKVISMSLLNWIQAKFNYEIFVFIANKLFKGYLSMPYSDYLKLDSAVIIKNNTHEVYNFSAVLNQFLLIATDIIIILGMLGLLIFYDPISLFVIIITLLLPVLILFISLKSFYADWGKRRELHDGETIKSIQNGLGAIKDIKVLGRELNFINHHKYHTRELGKVELFKGFIQSTSKHWLEYIFILAVFALATYHALVVKDPAKFLSTTALFSIAGFRVLPALNRVANGVQFINFYKPSISLISREFEKLNSRLDISNKVLSFKENIEMKNISYFYNSKKLKALNNITFLVSKGEAIGIAGISGSGKSTLINILLGLLKPTGGEIFIDGHPIEKNLKGWQSLIGFVPQNTFLTNDTILNNIAFGIPKDKIDYKKIDKCINLASLRSTIESFPEKINTYVGERGIKLSGGQLQRIGIARALYDDPEILILDEATNALDSDTENEIMESINNLKRKKTIIMITHKIENLLCFDRVYKLDNGNIIASGTYSELFK